MSLQRTPLYQLCINAGCRTAPFAGWEMPIQFSGLVKEHEAVRNQAGLFDISHMGVIELVGENVKDELQRLVPTDLHRIGEGEACYTLLLNQSGGIIDDLIIYDLGNCQDNKQALLLVINAGCTENDITWLRKNLESKNIEILDKKQGGVLLALQGPKAQKLLENFSNETLTNLPPFGHRKIALNIKPNYKSSVTLVARTGYTGEDGFELLMPAELGQYFWNKMINNGVIPCGLGARDTLRMEAGMHLYGNDMNAETTPFEAGLGWLVHLEMPSNFIGRDVLEKQAKEGVKKRLIGLQLEGRAIARKGYKVFDQNILIGQVTSGTWSPTLGKAIALAYVPIEHSKLGSKLFVEVRNKKYPATIVKKAFYRKR